LVLLVAVAGFCGSAQQISSRGNAFRESPANTTIRLDATRNNGITEGFHNKMETISRVAYGFRNFENYRLRVKVLCS
jgi:hypothetical protein